MRDSYPEFTKRGAEILAVGPDALKPFQKYWANEKIPYIGLPDPTHRVARLYRQEVKLFKLGRMPMNAILDTAGYIRYVHYSANMADIPDNEAFIQVIDQLNAASA
jgi:peroxiredoxin Q/BCP